MPRKDIDQTAFDVVRRATGEELPEPVDEKKNNARESGRRGDFKGGVARAQALTPEQRRLTAKRAALARWGHKKKK